MAKEAGGKLTMKNLSGEMEALREQVRELELQLERKLESSLEKAAEKLKSRAEAARRKNDSGPAIDTATRRQMIAEFAYLRAEARGFTGGDPQQDWLEAEKEVNRILMQ
jgi:hypothetical protein